MKREIHGSKHLPLLTFVLMGWTLLHASAAIAQSGEVDGNPVPDGARPDAIDISIFRPRGATDLPEPIGNENSVYSGDIELLPPQYNGTGCPQDSIAFSLSPDKKTASMLFLNYTAEAGTQAGVSQSIKNCVVDLPIRNPPGFRAIMTQVDVRGFTDVPSGARSQVIGGFQFVDRQTRQPISHAMNRRQIFNGPYSDEFFLSSGTSQQPGLQLISACGRDFVLRINTQLGAQTNAGGEQVLSSIESMDTQSTSATLPNGTPNRLVNYHLRWERCAARRAVTRPIGVPPGRPGQPVHPGGNSRPAYPVKSPVNSPAPGNYPQPAPRPIYGWGR